MDVSVSRHDSALQGARSLTLAPSAPEFTKKTQSRRCSHTLFIPAAHRRQPPAQPLSSAKGQRPATRPGPGARGCKASLPVGCRTGQRDGCCSCSLFNAKGRRPATRPGLGAQCCTTSRPVDCNKGQRISVVECRHRAKWQESDMLQPEATPTGLGARCCKASQPVGCAIAKGQVLLMLLNAPPWSKRLVLHSIAACGLYEQEAEGRVF